ncbi:MAG: peptide chain release factor 2, partial [Aerococcus viridans]
MNLKSIASGGLFDLDKLEVDLAALESEMVQPGFWDNSEKAQAVIDQNNNLKKIYDNFNDLVAEWENLSILNDMVKEEPDAELQAELEEGITAYQSKISAYERNILLSGEYDHNDALLEIHPGAGGTESQDWASMLLRMYQRWAERHDYQVTTLEYQNGDEAGIKSVTLEIKGLNAYGFLRSEDGIHRLVRISPFDSNNRRHTSFASVEIMPVLDQNTEID